MENRITKIFGQKHQPILSIYFTAGYPMLDITADMIKTLAASGVDMIEIGMPYSDPLADGPVIQHSSEVAIKNGMSIEVLFNQLANIRESVSIPLVLMGYFNPVLQYGVEKFCQKASEIGIDGVIIPDLPLHEYVSLYKPLFEKHNLSNVFLISPQSSEARIKEIDAHSQGFIYMVSSAATTGTQLEMGASQTDYFNRIVEMKLANPTMIGFGISDKASFDTACNYANGAIIGTAFIKAISNDEPLKSAQKYIASLR